MKQLIAGLLGAVVIADPSTAVAQTLGGYGELLFSYHDYGPDQTQEGGSPPDNRLVFDTTRLVAKIEQELVEKVAFEAEVEFEHGGTGAELELEYEEFGEFEDEVEKGGEVLVEELYVEWEPMEGLELKAGRFYVALGLLSELYRPTDYLGSARPEGETRLLPAVWDEQGVSAKLERGDVELTLQLVNGLDSSGFSSQFWVSSGQQGRFELTRASGLALAGRIDYTGVSGLTLGASSYFGDTAGNRPKHDMAGVFAPVYLGDVHAVYNGKRVRARGTAIWGHLWKAAEISDKNSRLSNNLGVLRTPVASQGLAVWAEVGVDIAPWLGLCPANRLEPFLRVEHYDTMFATDDEIFDNPRFARTIVAIGAAHTFSERLVSTIDISHRRLGSSSFRSENTVQVSLGFNY